MNALYYEQSDLWTPDIYDLDDEFETKNEDEEYSSLSKNNQRKGKWLHLWVSSIINPDQAIQMQVADE